jgi:hypothetical protein
MASMGRPALYMPLEDRAWEVMARVCAIVANDWSIINEPKDNAEFNAFAAKIAGHQKNTPLCAKIDQNYIMKNPKGAFEISGGKIYAPKLTTEDLLEWINSEMCEGKELLIIDPVSMINFRESGMPDWQAQEDFLQNLHAYAKYKNVHIMLLAHIIKRTYKGGKKTPLTAGDIQGSAAFERHTRYVLMLDYNPEGTESQVAGKMSRLMMHKHTLQIEKVNFGCGTGSHLAFTYAKGGPQFVEHGLIHNDLNQHQAQRRMLHWLIM